MESDLETALFTELAAFAAARSLPIAWPNVAFSTDTIDAYMRVDVLATEPDMRGIETGWSRYTWLVQASFYAKAGTGELPDPLSHVDAFTVAYPVLHLFIGADHTFQVTRPVARFPSVASDGWIFIPAQLRVSTIK